MRAKVIQNQFYQVFEKGRKNTIDCREYAN